MFKKSFWRLESNVRTARSTAGFRPERRSREAREPASPPRRVGARSPAARCVFGSPLFFLAVLLSGLGACRTAPLPKINLSQPGWVVRQGQAVWRPRRQAPEIAGDVIYATHPDGRNFIQFSKSPLTLVVVETTPSKWQLEIPMQNRHYRGRGAPPKRMAWLILPSLLSDARPPSPWLWQQNSGGNWRLENPKTGESLEGYFLP